MNITKEEILKARAEAQEAYQKGTMVAYTSKVVGLPYDPLKPYAPVLETICQTDTLPVGDNYLSYDVDEDTKYVYVIDNTGVVTTQQVTVGAPTGATFYPCLTRQEKIHIVDLLTAKYDVIAKKNKAVVRSLDAIEEQKVIALLNSGTAAGNRVLLATGETKFRYSHLIDMIEKVQNYASKFALVCGSQIYSDMRRWDFDENKYHSVKDMLDDLGLVILRAFGSVTVGGVATDLINTNKAYLVGLDGIMGKPLSAARQMLPEKFAILEEVKDAQKERTTIISPALMADGSPAMGIVGFESFAIVLTNSKVLAAFYRASVWA